MCHRNVFQDLQKHPLGQEWNTIVLQQKFSPDVDVSRLVEDQFILTDFH